MQYDNRNYKRTSDRKNYNNNNIYRNRNNRKFKPNNKNKQRYRFRNTIWRTNNPNQRFSNYNRYSNYNKSIRPIINKSQKNSNLTKTQKKLNNIVSRINKLSLDMAPKTTNLLRRLKEPRTDRIVLPMDMGLSHRFTSIFKTSNRIRYVSLYNRIEVEAGHNTYFTNILWFPYAVNFSQYPNLAITVDDGNGGTVQPNTIGPFVLMRRLPDTTALASAGIFTHSNSGLVGNYRIVGATMKITNTSSLLNRAGSYIIYKLNENTTYPPFYKTSLAPNITNSPDYFNTLNDLVSKSHDQVVVKQSYSASDIALVNEFNVYEGNNIFQGPDEYLGASYISSPEPVALWSGNPTGNNIKYQIDFQKISSVNNYLIESWQVFEVVPDPNLGLDNIADLQTHVFDKDVLAKLKDFNPLGKAL